MSVISTVLVTAVAIAAIVIAVGWTANQLNPITQVDRVVDSVKEFLG